MKELISPMQADALFGIAVPVLGIFILGAVRAVKKDRRLALLLGGPLVLAGLLWWVYSAITRALGLDTVLNLMVNFGLFLAIGVGSGLAWRTLTPRPPLSQEPTASANEGEAE
jgi:drug/metabolite transporter (DMT)-like permease